MRDDKKPILSSAMNFGILTAVVWFLVNQFWTVGGIGILQQQPWPLSSITACGIAGAVAGLALGIALAANRRKHSRQIAALCEKLGFEFIRDISQHQFFPYRGLSLFSKRRWRGRNLMRGMTNGSNIDVLDFDYVEPGSEGGETLDGQTVAVFPECGEGLPCFELKPRDLVLKFLGRTAGIGGMTFEAGDSTREFDREAIEQFGHLYFLSPPLENVWDSWERERVHEEIGSDQNNGGEHQILAAEAALAQF